MTNDEYLERDLYWCEEMRKYAGLIVRVTEGADEAGFVGELLGWCGLYTDGSAMLAIKNRDKVVVVSSDNIEYI